MGVHHKSVVPAVERVPSKGDAAGLGRQQGHDHDRHGDRLGVKTEPPAIGDGLGSPAGGPDIPNPLQYCLQPDEIESGEVDAGEGGRCRILRGGGGMDRQGPVEPAFIVE